MLELPRCESRGTTKLTDRSNFHHQPEVLTDVQHLAATPLGERVICRARVIHSDGTLISFQLEAHDEHERIARGVHKLRVIQVARFAERVQRKRRS